MTRIVFHSNSRNVPVERGQ